MDNVMVYDTCEAIVVDSTRSKTYFLGSTESSSVKSAMDKTELTGGIGDLVQAILQTKKKITFDVQCLFYGDNIVELTQGGTMATDTKDVLKSETLQAVDNTGSIEITITGTPTDTVKVVDKNNKEMTTTNADSVYTITDGVAGAFYTAIYTESKSVDYLDLNGMTFPTAVHVQLHTIGYDPDTNEVIYDYYWDFPKALPEGNIDYAFSKSTNTNPTISFQPIADNAQSYGTYMRVTHA